VIVVRPVFTVFVLILARGPALAQSESVYMDALVQRDSLFFQKISSTPFPRDVRGRGYIQDGNRDGPWIFFHLNGQMESCGPSRKASPMLPGCSSILVTPPFQNALETTVTVRWWIRVHSATRLGLRSLKARVRPPRCGGREKPCRCGQAICCRFALSWRAGR
jgi:hypothetical protein